MDFGCNPRNRPLAGTMPAKVEAILPLPGLSPVGGKPLVARFDGGRLSSDGGVLALREIERRPGIADRLAACLEDPRAPEAVRHSLADIIRFRLLMIAAGYEDGNDAATLRHDPAFKLALDRLPDAAALCSQPTISRLENLPDLRALLRMGRAMVGLYCASFRQVPRRIVLNLDDTFDAVHGGQQLRLLNACHDEYGFQPLVVFDGEGRPVAAMLRPARRPTGAEARGFPRRLVREIRGHWPRAEILIRADSHFCAPEVLDFCRAALEASTAARQAASPAEGKRRPAARPSSTAPGAGHASSGSSPASKPGRRAPTPASSSPPRRAAIRAQSTQWQHSTNQHRRDEQWQLRATCEVLQPARCGRHEAMSDVEPSVEQPHADGLALRP
jgi:hypothetical protein